MGKHNKDIQNFTGGSQTSKCIQQETGPGKSRLTWIRLYGT